MLKQSVWVGETYVSNPLGLMFKKQTRKSPSSREKYLKSVSNSDGNWTVSSPDVKWATVLFRSTRISYQLSVEKPMARHTTHKTEMMVAIDRLTAEQAMMVRLQHFSRYTETAGEVVANLMVKVSCTVFSSVFSSVTRYPSKTTTER